MENTFVKHNQWLLRVSHFIHKNLIHYTVHVVYLFLLGTLHFFYLSTLHFKDQRSKEDSWRTEDTPCYYPTKAIKTYMNEKALLIKIKPTKYYPQTAVITSTRAHTHVRACAHTYTHARARAHTHTHIYIYAGHTFLICW